MYKINIGALQVIVISLLFNVEIFCESFMDVKEVVIDRHVK
jgi:hypothetical protein